MKTLTSEEAAGFLKMHPDTVKEQARAGLIPGAKVGKRWVFIESDLEDLIRQRYRERPPIPEPSPSVDMARRGTSARVLDDLLAARLKAKGRKR